jgi:protocatechuate 3,4-dioxygenase beta subunit
MERKEFLQKGFSSLLGVAFLGACNKASDVLPTASTGSTNGSSATDCNVNPTETEGPFPTKTPASFVTTDIRSDRTGVLLNLEINIKNKTNGCNALAGALVDIWHCDADGNYSEYGGGGMQSTNYTTLHFLRGRQTSDTNGLVKFTTIFPGWYSGRATHIHVHIYNATGKSLLVTQIAFPEDICKTVHTTATTIYKKGQQDTTNARDNVFSDGVTLQMASLAGSVSAGYKLTHNIVVSA